MAGVKVVGHEDEAGSLEEALAAAVERLAEVFASPPAAEPAPPSESPVKARILASALPAAQTRRRPRLVTMELRGAPANRASATSVDARRPSEALGVAREVVAAPAARAPGSTNVRAPASPLAAMPEVVAVEAQVPINVRAFAGVAAPEEEASAPVSITVLGDVVVPRVSANAAARAVVATPAAAAPPAVATRAVEASAPGRITVVRDAVAPLALVAGGAMVPPAPRTPPPPRAVRGTPPAPRITRSSAVPPVPAPRSHRSLPTMGGPNVQRAKTPPPPPPMPARARTAPPVVPPVVPVVVPPVVPVVVPPVVPVVELAEPASADEMAVVASLASRRRGALVLAASAVSATVVGLSLLVINHSSDDGRAPKRDEAVEVNVPETHAPRPGPTRATVSHDSALAVPAGVKVEQPAPSVVVPSVKIDPTARPVAPRVKPKVIRRPVKPAMPAAVVPPPTTQPQPAAPAPTADDLDSPFPR
ncbi:MAG: hypothetical protein SFX73_36160 [Kofleriaceae bacterium]|nr:hypothetical protein [Kofleriaceae bacterium]